MAHSFLVWLILKYRGRAVLRREVSKCENCRWLWDTKEGEGENWGKTLGWGEATGEARGAIDESGSHVNKTRRERATGSPLAPAPEERRPKAWHFPSPTSCLGDLSRAPSLFHEVLALILTLRSVWLTVLTVWWNIQIKMIYVSWIWPIYRVAVQADGRGY